MIKQALRHCLLLVLCATAADVGGEPASRATTLDALRAAGVRIAQAADDAYAGQAPTAALLQDLRRTLGRLHAQAIAEPAMARKYRAIALAFGELEHAENASGQTALRAPTKAAAVETVSSTHGGDCGHALGLAPDFPIEVVLGQSLTAGADAWFALGPQRSARVRLSAHSSRADPALEVWSSCGAKAPVAANDDSIGLDASLILDTRADATVYVHVRNSGYAGSVLVGVQGTSGTIGGIVSLGSGGSPVANASVLLLGTNGAFQTATQTAADGSYTLTSTPGTYYVRVAADGLVSQLYPAVSCAPTQYADGLVGCDTTHAQTIMLVDNSSISGIDFALDAGHAIFGQVRDSHNFPLGADVVLFDATGTQLQGTTADEAGRYTFDAIPDGTYKLASAKDGYVFQLYDRVPCYSAFLLQCDLSSASPVSVAADVHDVDFSLLRLAAITGTVTEVNGGPLGGATVNVLDAATLNMVASAQTLSDGTFRAGALPVGQYAVFASASGHFSQLYAAYDCGTVDCHYDLGHAVHVSIAQPGQDAGANFQLQPTPAVSGHVQDAVTGLPLANVQIQLAATFGLFLPTTQAVTDNEGNYTLRGLNMGRSWVWARSTDHVDEFYPDLPCNVPNAFTFGTPCNLATAYVLDPQPGQVVPTLDFALQPSAAISGRVLLNAGAGSDLPALAQVTLFDALGHSVRSVLPDTTGNYQLTDLAGGSYFAVAQPSTNPYFVGQIWPGLDCVSACDPTGGTAVNVAPDASRSGIDFLVTRQDAVTGRVTDSNGAPVAGAVVDLFLAADASYVGSGIADAQGYYVTPAPLEYNYFVATDAGPGFVDQIHAGIQCPLGPAYYGLCAFTAATSVSLSATTVQAQHANFTLQRANLIFANGFD